MPVASATTSGWKARSAFLAPLFGALLLLHGASAAAQEAPLRLRMTDRLSLSPKPADSNGESTRESGQPAEPPKLTQGGAHGVAAVAAATEKAGPPAEVLLQTDVNQQGLDETVLMLRLRSGTLLIAGEDLDRWRIRRPDAVPFVRGGRSYYPLEALPGVAYRIDESKQTLQITTSPEAFTGTVASVPANARGEPILPQPGAFLNYTLSGSRSSGETTQNGVFEVGLFSRLGVLTSGLVAPDLTKSSTWTRLDTTYTADFPERMTSLRVGDAVAQPGTWGRAPRFGGIQYGTDFGTQPGFIRYPYLSAAGQAAVPSTVDVFINNALVISRNVPPGPFSVTNIPVVSGSGDMRVVVRDVLGREQVVTMPFYGTTALLQAGLSAYSYDLGVEREAFGVASNQYGAGLGAATYRHGVTDSFTAEVRAEASKTSSAGGVSGAYRVGNLGIVNGTVALSRSDAGSGRLVGYGLERLGDRLGFFFQSTLTSPEFRQVGMPPDELPTQRQTAASMSYTLGALGSVSLAYAVQKFRDRPELEVATLGYSVPLGSFGQLGLSAARTFGAEGGTTVFAYVAVPLGDLTSASASLERSRSNETGKTENHHVVTAQRSLPVGDGYGYLVQVRDSDVFGSLSLQTGFGTYVIDAARAKSGDTSGRIGASGGIGTIGGHTFFSRMITDSFGVVHVADYPDVRVLQDNQVVARTNSAGYAVLPRLRPYERNPIAIDQADLPFDAKVDTLKLQASPYFRSGVLIEFPISRVRAGTLQIVLDDGSDLPSGALARFEGREQEFPVALRGEAYLEGFEEENRLHISWKGQACVIDVPYPRTADPLPNLGRFRCRGVKQ